MKLICESCKKEVFYGEKRVFSFRIIGIKQEIVVWHEICYRNGPLSSPYYEDKKK